ncbi:MAG: class I SAM-dependent methyltransferase [Verrucomicrobia bacterium]|nr:class I SAM-dependent methyltransferase [Verrucomicrobiota bacterium]
MYREITQCRICGNQHLVEVLNLGTQYLTGVFPRSKETTLSCGPVQLVKCSGSNRDLHCGLVQMKHSFSASEMYGETYGYRSGLNRGMVDHLHRKADQLMNRVRLGSDDLVLDIGSNDGTSLSRYPSRGPRLVGFDPSARKFRHYYRSDIELHIDFFSAAAFRRIYGDRKARIITSIAMFYDLEDPQGFADDVAAILADDGIWHLEQSYLPAMLETNSYDTACHEHLEYYALRQIEWIASRAGLRVIDVERNGVNGGSFAVTLAKTAGKISANQPAIEELRTLEMETGLDSAEPFSDFRTRIQRSRDELHGLLSRLQKEGKVVAGYGASTKGNVLLQFCSLGPREIPFIAEVNEDKFGCFTPGTGIPIISEAEANARAPDYYLVLPWHFREGIIRRELAFLKRGGRFIFPLPNVEVVQG